MIQRIAAIFETVLMSLFGLALLVLGGYLALWLIWAVLSIPFGQ